MTYKIVRSVEFALCRHTLQQTILFKNSKNHDEIPRDSIYKKDLETKHYETFSVQICRNSTFHYFISRLGINASKLFIALLIISNLEVKFESLQTRSHQLQDAATVAVECVAVGSWIFFYFYCNTLRQSLVAADLQLV